VLYVSTFFFFDRWFGDLLDPSGSPTAYSISVGWNVNEDVLGMYGDGLIRGGGTVKPVDMFNDDRLAPLRREVTSTF
jgi:hypothetical protein